MTPVYWLIWTVVIAFAATAVGGLVWAIQHGQMERFRAGARSIFDDEEPVGVPTDGFPQGTERPR
jgi:nitrogen fixation-related uncharacterized protein